MWSTAVTSRKTWTNSAKPSSVPVEERNLQKLHFPGDPRFGVRLSVIDDDLTTLNEDRKLFTCLLDFLIQQAASNPSTTLDERTSAAGGSSFQEESSGEHIYLGSLVTQAFMKRANECLGIMKKNSQCNSKIRSSLSGFADDSMEKRLIISIILSDHFYVLVVVLYSVTAAPPVYRYVECYDSLQRTRHSGSNASLIQDLQLLSSSNN